VGDALKSFLDASDEDLPTPDAAVISVTGTVEADACHLLLRRVDPGNFTPSLPQIRT